ncbi:O-acyltransferase WSD1 [Morus notabilis]|nr:O-acyltransferase WSD1 [Morus notabilis]
MGFKTKIDLDVFKPNLPSTLLKHPRFSSLLVDLAIYNVETADKFVEDYILNLSKTSIDKSMPLWDLHILNVNTSMAESVGIFRIHHSLGDGISLMSLFLASTALVLVKDSETPIKGPITSTSENNPRRKVFNEHGFESKNIEKGITGKKNNLPVKIRVRSILFINIRPSPGIQALADMMEKNTKAKWGNWLGFVILPLSIGLRDDPLDDIREAKAMCDRKRHSLEALCSSGVAGFVFKFFGIKPASSLFLRLFTSTTLAFPNVVGPLEEIGFYGHPLAYLAATTYGGQANELMVSMQSYMNKMSVVLSVDENTIPDPHQLCDDIIESLKFIKNSVVEKGLAK